MRRDARLTASQQQPQAEQVSPVFKYARALRPGEPRPTDVRAAVAFEYTVTDVPASAILIKSFWLYDMELKRLVV